MKSQAATYQRNLQVMVPYSGEPWAGGKLTQLPRLAHDPLEHITLFFQQSQRERSEMFV